VALTDAYVQTPGQIPDFFATLAQGQAPPQFTNQYLRDLGFTSTNHRAFIPLLKALGFLSADGAPTARYHSFRDGSQSRRVLGEAVKQAYGDLFLIRANPTDADRPLIEGKFKSAHNASDVVAKRLSNTFFGLLPLADVSVSVEQNPPVVAPEKPKVAPPTELPASILPVASVEPVRPHAQGGRASLHYNIQIHLPATKDIEVYNAIFKSLREHLLD
jgi:hypothetical protein